MKLVMFYHSLYSDWNHGNAHFLRGVVREFKNKNYDKEAPPHFHIALKTIQDEYLVLSMITSQVEKKIRYYTLTNRSLLDSVLIINCDDIDILEKENSSKENEEIQKTIENVNKLIEINKKIKNNEENQ